MDRFLLYFCENLSSEADTVDLAARDAATGLLAETLPLLRQSYRPLRFVHGDCHASVLFLHRRDNSWQVSGIVDMENCSAGAPAFDFVKLFIELGGRFGGRFAWWEPLFRGYQDPPDFNLIKTLLIGHAQINYTCLGEHAWPGTRNEIVEHILDADSWPQLFDLDSLR